MVYSSPAPPCRYEVSVGMVQIYNEQVDDLLCPDNHGLKVSEPWRAGRERPVTHPHLGGKGGGWGIVSRLLPGGLSCQVKQDITCGGWVVEGMAWRDVDSAAKLLEHITEARKRLVYAETKMNKHSSRSHCVVTLKVRPGWGEGRRAGSMGLIGCFGVPLGQRRRRLR